MSVDYSVVVSEELVYKMWFDAEGLTHGSTNQHPDFTVNRNDKVDTVMKEYLLKHGLVLADVEVFYGLPARSSYSCMGNEHTFGKDRFYWNQGENITIWLRDRTSAHPEEDLETLIWFVEEKEPHDRLFTGKSYCFELLQRVFERALVHFNMEVEQVTFSNRGNTVNGVTMTAHELFTANGLSAGDALTITVKFKRTAVDVRVVSDDCVFRQMCMESPLRRISAIMTDVATSRGLIIEACTFDVCNWLMTTFRTYPETTRLTDIQLSPLATRHVLCITGGSKRELEELVVTAGIQVAGHKRALEAHEQRARILVANAERDKHAHEHTVDFTRRHYEDALRFQKRVNEINAMHVSDQAILVSDASASLEASERKRARLEAVLAALEPAEPVPAPAPAEERVCLGECVVCLEKMFLGDSIMRFKPCGHSKVCIECIPGTVNLNVCPVCRKEILGTEPVFL